MTKICPIFDPRWQAPVDGEFDQDGDVLVQKIRDLSLHEVRAAAKARATNLRYDHETGGIAVGDMLVSTDRDSQSLITLAAMQVRSGVVTGPIAFKHQEGISFVDASNLVQVADLVTGHVQAGRWREAELWAAIDAADTVDGVLAVDLTSGWPA